MSRVFIVPDGSLHLVNWAALPIEATGYLIERAPLLHYLSAERDLGSVGARAPSASAQRLLVIDSPEFDDGPGVSARAAGSSAFRGTKPDCGDLDWLRFDPLPASTREAETIVGIWNASRGSTDSVLRLSGPAATEAALKERAAGARVLHLATHGFFLGDRCTSGDAGNPLLLAGFALAGANRRGAAGPDDEDGILTAEEVAALDLRSVEWAVLSACDTGVGEVRAGEGVFGLRRAFQVAGARTVIMSLWPVDDENTRRWMKSVYEQRFAHGATTMEATRKASLDELRRRRQAGLTTHPFYWGAFIAAGDWR
jgi:CHAT domain-containing protein